MKHQKIKLVLSLDKLIIEVLKKMKKKIFQKMLWMFIFHLEYFLSCNIFWNIAEKKYFF
jgi:hypothetical protein